MANNYSKKCIKNLEIAFFLYLVVKSCSSITLLKVPVRHEFHGFPSMERYHFAVTMKRKDQKITISIGCNATFLLPKAKAYQAINEANEEVNFRPQLFLQLLSLIPSTFIMNDSKTILFVAHES